MHQIFIGESISEAAFKIICDHAEALCGGFCHAFQFFFYYVFAFKRKDRNIGQILPVFLYEILTAAENLNLILQERNRYSEFHADLLNGYGSVVRRKQYVSFDFSFAEFPVFIVLTAQRSPKINFHIIGIIAFFTVYSFHMHALHDDFSCAEQIVFNHFRADFLPDCYFGAGEIFKIVQNHSFAVLI